jgi:hypothetical protein
MRVHHFIVSQSSCSNFQLSLIREQAEEGILEWGGLVL